MFCVCLSTQTAAQPHQTHTAKRVLTTAKYGSEGFQPPQVSELRSAQLPADDGNGEPSSAVRASSHSMLQSSPSRRPVQDRINIGTGSVSPSFAPPAFQCDQLPAASHAQARIPIVAANQLAQLQLHDRLLTPPVGGSHVQDRIPMRPGTLMRTVAVRRDHVPSHYAMLGVPRDFSPELLKKQYRLLALRYHPDAAERNGVDADEVADRFIALQTAYEVRRANSAQFGAQFGAQFWRNSVSLRPLPRR